MCDIRPTMASSGTRRLPLPVFDVKVTADTSSARNKLIEVAAGYVEANPDVPCHPQGGKLGATEYQNVVVDSKFTISPGGHNPETFRMYEALEAG